MADMAQAADTAPTPGMPARTDLVVDKAEVVDTADKVGRAVRQRLWHECSRLPAVAFAAGGKERLRPPGSGQ